MKRIIAMLLLLLLLPTLLMTGCFLGNEEETKLVVLDPHAPAETKAANPPATNPTPSDPSEAGPGELVVTSPETAAPPETQAPGEEGVYPEDIHLESAEYTGEGTGKDAVYEIVAVLSAAAVARGWNLGDVWARVGDVPTFGAWDGINTYEPGRGTEIHLPSGGVRVTWRTKLYFPQAEEGSLELPEGTEVTIGVNAAGQDENGQWAEGPITNTLTVKWAKK